VTVIPTVPLGSSNNKQIPHSLPNDVFKPTFPSLSLYECKKYLKEDAFFVCMKKKLNSLIAKNTFNNSF
jgi:hypothetical protein